MELRTRNDQQKGRFISYDSTTLLVKEATFLIFSSRQDQLIEFRDELAEQVARFAHSDLIHQANEFGSQEAYEELAFIGDEILAQIACDPNWATYYLRNHFRLDQIPNSQRTFLVTRALHNGFVKFAYSSFPTQASRFAYFAELMIEAEKHTNSQVTGSAVLSIIDEKDLGV